LDVLFKSTSYYNNKISIVRQLIELYSIFSFASPSQGEVHQYNRNILLYRKIF